MAGRIRDLALFNLAIDSKLRACDLVRLRLSDIVQGGRVVSRATVVQNKTGQPVRFELTEQTRDTVEKWIGKSPPGGDQFLFPSRIARSPHLSTRQYSRIVKGWVSLIGLNPAEYGTHSLRRTKATLSYRRTKNLRAVQLLLGHAKLESTVRYLGIEVDDALEMAEQTEVQSTAGREGPLASVVSRPGTANRVTSLKGRLTPESGQYRSLGFSLAIHRISALDSPETPCALLRLTSPNEAKTRAAPADDNLQLLLLIPCRWRDNNVYQLSALIAACIPGRTQF